MALTGMISNSMQNLKQIAIIRYEGFYIAKYIIVLDAQSFTNNINYQDML